MLDGNHTIFGLDISDRALRVIQLKHSGKKTFITSYGSLSLEPGIFDNGVIIDESKAISAIQKVIKDVTGGKIKTPNVVSVLPETKTFIKVITVPASRDTKKPELNTIINAEIVNHVPLGLEEIYLDWQVLHHDGDQAHVLIGAAPRTLVDSYITLIEKSGLVPYALEIEAQAIVRTLFPQQTLSHATIVIDFGAMRTGLALYDNDTIQFTVTLPISGNDITQVIAQVLQIKPEEAEKAKIVCGLDSTKCEGAMLKILMKPIDELANHIKKAITFYQSNFPEGREVKNIILTGGGSNFIKIDEVLTSKLGITTTVGNPFTNIVAKGKNGIPKKQIMSYVTAIGLALRGATKKDVI